MSKINVIIAGAGGRDFQNFLVYFKNNSNFNVVAFTATQIPGIEKRHFPKELSGSKYKKGIKIYPEKDLPNLIKKLNVDYVYLCYSDLSHQQVGDIASVVLANGANFGLLGTEQTWIKSKIPVISVCAVRTGCGKSRVTRKIGLYLKSKNKRFVILRHPMPYGDLNKQAVQKFYTYEDLIKAKCTVEELEEYEHHIRQGFPVFAGVDYEKILREAEKEADVILWDGGNNDFSFIKPDLNLVLVDPRRAGHGLSYYPGEVNLRIADIVIVNRMFGITNEQIQKVKDNVKSVNKNSKIVDVTSLVLVEDPKLIRNKKVLIIGDGPTLTHGGMATGIGTAAAIKYKAKKIVEPRKYAVGSIKETYEKFPHLKSELSAMGYSKKQLKDLEKSINRVPCDIIIDGTPSDIKKLIKIKKEVIYSGYDIDEKTLGPIYKAIDKIIK
ncbi:GTPase [archaeon]|nr:GTPase [archaeon]